MTKKCPNITDYEHYPDFLKAKFLFFKSKRRGFSYRSCAKKINSTASYLKNVIEGRCRVGMSRISKIASLFELNEFETCYFSFQVIRDLIDDKQTRDYFTNILSRFKCIGEYASSTDDFKFTSEPVTAPTLSWLHQVLVGLIEFPDFEDSDSWIRGKLIDGPDLTSTQIRDAIKDLLEMKIIEKKGNKYFMRPLPPSVERAVTPADPFDPARHKVMRSLIQKTWEVLGAVDKYKANFFFQGVVTVSKEDFELLTKTAIRHQNEIIQIVENSKKPEQVVAIANNLFTLAK